MKRLTVLLLVLAGCSEGPSDTSNAAIANGAESLERAADATTDQLIAEIEAQVDADIAAQTNVAAEAGNAVE